jgi:transcriptional regulator with XRE-family HTH domain
MDSIPRIARRLDIWLRAENRADRKFTAAKVCLLIKVEENAFSQYRNAKRPLPIEVADVLCEKFGLSLDWLYRGDPRNIEIDLQLRMQEIEEYDKTLMVAGERLKAPRRKRA